MSSRHATLTIARKEWREAWRDGRVRSTALTILLLVGASLLTAWRGWSTTRAIHIEAQAATRRQWLTQPPNDPHRAAHFGVYAFAPRMPLAFIDQGVDPYVGVLAFLEAHRENDFEYRPMQDEPDLARFGAWTAAAVLQVLVPLLIIAACAGVFAGERERGTLRQLLSIGVPPRALLTGKLLGVTGALTSLLAPIALVGAAAIVLAGHSSVIADRALTAPGTRALMSGATETSARVAILALLYAAYFALFALIALAVSLRARTTRSALTALLVWWAAGCFLVPRLAADAARLSRPSPTAFSFNAALEQALTSPARVAREAAFRDSVIQANGAANVDALPFNFAAPRRAEAERLGNQTFDAAFGGLQDTYRAQDEVRRWFALLTPLVALRTLSAAVAGTDLGQHRTFAIAAERYRRTLVNTMSAMLLHAPQKIGQYSMTVGADAFATIPEFRYDPPRLTRILADHVADTLVIALWLVVALALVVRAQRRVTLNPDVSA